MTKKSSARQNKVIIVGAGWSGLAAAVILALEGRGKDITILEAAPKAGGRARSITFQGQSLDNGQHLLLGAYQETLALLQSIGVPENRVFTRTPLRLWIESANAGIDFKMPNLPFPLNLMVAFITAKGLSKQDRSAALKFYRALMTLQFEVEQDISVAELLLEYRQPSSLIEHLWEPLTLAALSTPIKEASAQVFLQIIKKTFAKNNQHSNFLFPKKSLSEVLPNPLLYYLKKQKVNIHYHQRAESIRVQNGSCLGVKTKNQTYEGSEVILAIPPDSAAELLVPHLEEHSELVEWHLKLTQFQYQPIMTIYLILDKPAKLPYPLMGLVQQTGHWVMDRITTLQPNILAVVITGYGSHLEKDHASLVATVYEELKQRYPHLGQVQQYKVITEKKAAFACKVGIEAQRPLPKLPIAGITLAGDYIQSGFPASLEAAVLSGKMAAEIVLSKKAIAERI